MGCRCSAVRAEDGAEAFGYSTDRAVVGGERVAHDVTGYAGGLLGVVIANAAWHEEALNKAEEGGDAGPEKYEIENTESGAAQIEMMSTEGAQEEREDDTDRLVSSGAAVLSVEPVALLRGHVVGVRRCFERHHCVPPG